MPDPDDDREIADASSLFDDGEPEPPRQAPSPPGEGAEESTSPSADPGSYELAEHEFRGSPEPSRTPEEPDPPSAAVPPRVPLPVDRPAKSLTPAPVDRPWSRWEEWGPDLARIALASAVTLGVFFLVFSFDRLLLSLVVLAIGFGAIVILSYPIAITLERPVRMTPEHAIRDYYAALSHHLPHYRRMWLLLSSAGRAAPEYSSFDEFRAYWSKRISELKGEEVGMMTPIHARIEEFKAEKSGGQDAIEAAYTLALFLRGREGGRPLYTSRVETTLSRGADRMWYLDEGRLPGD